MEINYTITEKARPTKDVLGDHLHYKINQALQPLQCAPELQLGAKITKLLLNQPIRDICAMLADNRVLGNHIAAGLNSQSPQIDSSVLSSFQTLVEDMEGCDTQEIGTIVYYRVSLTEPYLAPKITGMLLELDERTLSSLLSNEQHQMFDLAVQKAKQVLQPCQSNAARQEKQEQENLDADVKILTSPEDLDCSATVASQTPNSRDVEAGQSTDGEIDNDDDGGYDVLWKERVGDFVYHEAVKAYPDSAAHITGMMLELGPTLLQELLANPSMLRNTIDKCHQAWLSSVNQEKL